MIRTVLIDDERDSISVLRRLLDSYCPEIEIVGTADGVETGAQLIRSVGPDLAFLDIEMTRGNAFDLLNRLKPVSFQVIFVTAFDEYAIKAFKCSAVDYLLKPIDIEDLREAVGKAIRYIHGKSFQAQMSVLLDNMDSFRQGQQKMAIPTLTGLIFVALADIMRLEAKGAYTLIYLHKSESVMATRNIKEYEELLPGAIFFRIHNSHIINIQRIQKYLKGRGGCVVMEDGSSIEVASRRKEEFLANFIK
jgi:two-component system LytT family response regulator